MHAQSTRRAVRENRAWERKARRLASGRPRSLPGNGFGERAMNVVQTAGDLAMRQAESMYYGNSNHRSVASDGGGMAGRGYHSGGEGRVDSFGQGMGRKGYGSIHDQLPYSGMNRVGGQNDDMGIDRRGAPDPTQGDKSQEMQKITPNEEADKADAPDADESDAEEEEESNDGDAKKPAVGFASSLASSMSTPRVMIIAAVAMVALIGAAVTIDPNLLEKMGIGSSGSESGGSSTYSQDSTGYPTPTPTPYPYGNNGGGWWSLWSRAMSK